MSSEIEQLNSLDNFLNSEDLQLSLRIKRDLFLYLQRCYGSGLFSRNYGAMISKLENESNYEILDYLIKTEIVQAVGRYNLTVSPELQAVVGSDMVAAKYEENLIQILVIFVPMIKPSVDYLSNFIISVPIYGG